LRLPWFAALVRGPSMAPTLRAGDAVLVVRTSHPRVGDVVVGHFLARPALPVVKRIARREGAAWWLLGDNEYGTDDSRTYGPAEVVGRVVLRYWPRPGWVRRAGR
jgi:phage repressor protein C with HTH and peptisase S24 domain